MLNINEKLSQAINIEPSSLKKRILKLLEEDEEFRLAVAAKVGLLKILEKLEQHDRKFNEILERLDRHGQILLRHERILEKHTRALGSLGEDVGLLVEAFLSQRVEDSIRERIGDENDKLLTVRYRFMVNRNYEVDMYVETEKKIYVIEIKSRPSVRDVDKLARIHKYLSRKEVKEIIALLVAFKAKVQKRIIDKASRYNIELILY